MDGRRGIFCLCQRRRPQAVTAARTFLSVQQLSAPWQQHPARYEFPEEAALAVADWQGVEQSGAVQKPGRQSSCRFYRLPSLLSKERVEKVLQHIQQHAYEKSEDSVDKRPAFEYYPYSSGVWVDTELRDLLSDFIEHRLLPYIRQRYSRESCALADILVRRYLPDERRTHAVHFDGHAYVTAVLGLSDPDQYEGGLYVQPEADASSRKFFRIEPGDLVVHSFDLQHGVLVWGGIRYSMVFWVKDSIESVHSEKSPWYEQMLGDDDPDVLHNVAQNFEHGLSGSEQDMEKALELYERCAKLGHHFAQHNLAKMMFALAQDDDGPEADALRAKAAMWMRSAAEQGFALAQKAFALSLVKGEGVEEDCQQAAEWMRKAAEQVELDAVCYMGDFYTHGCGLPINPCEAALWYARGAEAGMPRAQYELGKLYLQGSGVPQDLNAAELWLKRAVAQDFKKAKKRLTALTRVK